MPGSWAQAVYVLAAVLFVLSLAGLSKQETARRGNVAGMVGMALALLERGFPVFVRDIVPEREAAAIAEAESERGEES